MTPEELRADMPATERVAYFNTGASGPSPRRVVDAMTDFQEHHEYASPAEEGMYTSAIEAVEDARRAVAGLLSTTPRNVALTQSTTDGVNLVADAFEWEAGDRVVRTGVEHSAGVLPWRRLRDLEGIEIEVVEGDAGRFDPDDFKAPVADAKLVCLSSLSWNHGTRLPVEEVVEIAHDAGARVLVDGVQSPGQRPVDVEAMGADFFVGAGHKWLLGPWGAGFLYASPEAAAAHTPRRIGWRSVEDPNAAEGYEFVEGAGRFEVSTTSANTYAGLAAAIETIRDVSLDAIRDRIERLTDRLKAGIDDDRLLSPEAFVCGLVSFEVDDPEAFVERLGEDGIVIRSIPYPECVRASVHAFNTEAEIDALLEHV